MQRRTLLLLLTALALSRSAQAQIQIPSDPAPSGIQVPDVPAPVFSSLFRPLPPEASGAGTGAAFDDQAQAALCDGCPPRRVGRAFLQTTMINVIYGFINLARGHDTAKITPKTWWDNMKNGWEWDLNDFTTNQFGHPYQGNNYYTSARSNGMNFWESSAMTAFGSATWEYFGETNDASLNDFINTTLGGIALGEMFYRAAWLVRDTHETGKGRMWKEIGATAIDPLTGFNRFMSGDATRVHDKPPDVVPSKLGSVATAGVLWHQEDSGSLSDATVSPYLELDLLYGDLTTGESRKPYDAFGVRLTMGGGAGLSEARVRGRLIGEPLGEGGLQFSVAQGFLYNKNDAYQFGAQSIDVSLGFVKRMSENVSFWGVGWGGATVLGAVDSVFPPGQEPPPPPETEDDEHAQPTERDYDYGPGTNAGGYLTFTHRNRAFLSFAYELHHLHVIDGVRGNHLLQRGRANLNLPLRGKLGVGVAGDIFYRKTFYQDQSIPDAHSSFPQFRVFLSWSQQ